LEKTQINFILTILPYPNFDTELLLQYDAIVMFQKLLNLQLFSKLLKFYRSQVKQPRNKDKITFIDDFSNEPYDDIDSLQVKDDLKHLKEVLTLYLTS